MRLDGLAHLGLELLGGHLAPRDADDGEPVGQEVAHGERVEGGEELALRQVAGRPEDRERAGLGRAAALEAFEERVFGRDCHSQSAFFTACPPNSLRSAAFTFAANDSSWREAKRA